MTRRRRVWAWAALAVATVVVLGVTSVAGCGGDAEGEDGGTTTSWGSTTSAEEATTTTTPPTVEQQIEAAFREWEAVMGDQVVEPNPDDPRLEEVMAQPQLSESRDLIIASRAKNVTMEIGPQDRSDILSITPHGDGTATVRLCIVGDSRTIDRDTGAVIDEGQITSLSEVSYRLKSGRWKMYDFRDVEVWPDEVRSCV